MRTETHSDKIKGLVTDAALTFTGKYPIESVKSDYAKVLSRFDVPSIKAAIELLMETHTFRTLPLPAEIIRIVQDQHDNTKGSFMVSAPQFMVFNTHPRSKAEMTNYLNDPKMKAQAYHLIKEWNALTDDEKEERWEEIGLGVKKSAENINRVKSLMGAVSKSIDSDEMVKCCLCGEDTLKFVSINEYLKYYDPDRKDGIDQYACHIKDCTKKIINNAGYEV